MAKTNAVWGIDIGQCALKALRCVKEGDEIVATAFDYIEYPKILSQPEADPTELVRDALEQFLSRNEVTGDAIAISVPGQSGLSRFFKPPPVDAKKIPDIVQYEAKQQIPFDLDDVIWDYQQMTGGAEVDGFALETEVGLFAMKREQVYRHIEPFVRAEVELDIVQLAPLALYNFVAYDMLRDGPAADEFDPDDPPESIVILSMGTETTDLVVTNGFRVWQRSIPLGGNHFTKQLTKDMKLTFAKAEHLKRNARQAEDPKAVFQAMRPVFNDMVTEVQRSIGYFQGIDRKAKIGRVVVLGNTVKLPGLQQYLAKNLGYEVSNFTGFEHLSGSGVVGAPAFKDNLLAFGVTYGLCVQGLNQGRLSTNLIPREILTNRMIRAKKPWALATVSAIVVACAIHFVFVYNSWYKVHEDREVNDLAWKQVENTVSAVQSTSSSHKNTDTEKQNQLSLLTQIGEEVVGNADRRLKWLELLKALNAALPQTPGLAPGTIPDPDKFPFDLRRELYVERIESEYFEDLSKWYTEPVKKKYVEGVQAAEALRSGQATNEQAGDAGKAAAADAAAAEAAAAEGAPAADGAAPAADGAAPAADGAAPAADAAAPAADAAAPAADPAAAPAAPTAPAAPGGAAPGAPAAGNQAVADQSAEGPKGPGWVIELQAYHFFNRDLSQGGPTHVRKTLLDFLENGTIMLPLEPGGQLEKFTLDELGIGYAILATDEPINRAYKIKNPKYAGPDIGGGVGASGDPGAGLDGLEGFADPSGSEGFGPGSEPSQGTAGETADGKKKEEVPPELIVPRYSFIVQFCWEESLLSERLEQRRQENKEQQQNQPAGNPNTVAATAN